MNTRTVYLKERNQRLRVEENKCPSCLTDMGTDKSFRCVACRKITNQTNKIRRDAMQARGICRSCEQQPAKPGFLKCQECCDKHNQSSRKSRKSVRQTVLDAYGGICACCSEAEPLFLDLDHVHNDGCTDILASGKRRAGSNALYRKIIAQNFPADYQILCRNCNWGKHINGGICPHKNHV